MHKLKQFWTITNDLLRKNIFNKKSFLSILKSDIPLLIFVVLIVIFILLGWNNIVVYLFFGLVAALYTYWIYLVIKNPKTLPIFIFVVALTAYPIYLMLKLTIQIVNILQ